MPLSLLQLASSLLLCSSPKRNPRIQEEAGIEKVMDSGGVLGWPRLIPGPLGNSLLGAGQEAFSFWASISTSVKWRIVIVPFSL